MDKKLLEEGLEPSPQFKKRGGLLPVIVQDCRTGELLMLAYANEEALGKTMDTGYATFWSTSRNELWIKGEGSGNRLKIKEVLTDCDQDALVYKVERLGANVCHTERRSCFYRRLAGGNRLEFLEK
jgi:phosphoribosyl-AMP cyclohydrolase